MSETHFLAIHPINVTTFQPQPKTDEKMMKGSGMTQTMAIHVDWKGQVYAKIEHHNTKFYEMWKEISLKAKVALEETPGDHQRL